jgi:hypothetical protein
MVWLDRIWDKHLLDGSGKSKIKIHAFGITSVKIMERYPWYSVDSSSWIQAAAFGNIITSEYGIKSISDKSRTKHVAGQHISTLTDIEKDHVLKMLEEQGFSYERLSEVYESRAAYNLWAFGKINKRIDELNDSKHSARMQELF